MRSWGRLRRASFLAAAISVVSGVTYGAGNNLKFSAAQVERGKQSYQQQCAACHGGALNNGEFAPPLKGADVLAKWSSGSAGDIFAVIHDRMPPTSPGSLSVEESVGLLAYIFSENGIEPGNIALPHDPASLARISVPPPTSPFGGAIADDVELPPPPAPSADPLRNIRPVTEAMIATPPEADWLTWRRTPEADGFSPLNQIDRTNVSKLRLAWAWSLPSGPNESTPLVHDGVMFVFGQGRDDVVQAIDAATGNLLWEYVHSLAKSDTPYVKKSLALLGTRLFFATSDNKVIALDVRKGALLWANAILPPGTPVVEGRVAGGPLVARGRIIVGTTGRKPGGNFVIALDPESGQERWRFATIPSPGQPGGDSWNGLPQDKRSGGSVWNPGSYDPASGLVYFGPAPTYDTGPLRDRVADPAVNNDALYTNNTIALDPESGQLRWHFSHRPNDQWDFDWSFERQIFDIDVDGVRRRAVVTGGKEAIFDILDAGTGAYIRSFDLGLQNIVKSIDPKTGAKDIDANLVPSRAKTITVCPSSEGGKNWLPNSLDPVRKILFVPLAESCEDFIPAGPGGGGLLTTGVKIRLRPRVQSDGRFGRLEAVDLRSGKPLWSVRQRAILTSGVLATAGGIVFAGDMDRNLIAFDTAKGRELWRTRLNGMPSSAVISYAVGSKQYVAVITSNGGHHATILARLTPEVRNPINAASTLWVFELPAATAR